MRELKKRVNQTDIGECGVVLVDVALGKVHEHPFLLLSIAVQLKLLEELPQRSVEREALKVEKLQIFVGH
jgi:hypothetical protein